MPAGVAATIIKTIKIVAHEMQNTNIYLQQTTAYINIYIYVDNIWYICFHLQMSMQQ